MPITRRFTVYTNAGVSVPPVIHVNQYDRGETWIFTLLEPNGSQYIPASGGIVGIKADGHAIINTATVNSNGEVVVSETQQMTAAPGKAVYEIIFDNSTHGTANFIVCVEPKPGDNATLSDSDLSLIQEAIDSTIPANIEASVQDWMDDNLAPAEWVIDNTLSIAGAAADAKKTGDGLSELKTELLKYNCANEFYFENGKHTNDGTSSGVTIAASGQDTFNLEGTSTVAVVAQYYFGTFPSYWNAEDTKTFFWETDLPSSVELRINKYIEGSESSIYFATVPANEYTEITMPSDAVGLVIYIRIPSGVTVNGTASLFINDGTLSNKQLMAEVNSLNDRITLTDRYTIPYNVYRTLSNVGLIYATNGSINSYANGRYSDPIKVKKGDIISYSLLVNGSSYCEIASCDSDGTFKKALVVGTNQVDEGTYTVTEDGYVRFGGRVEQLPNEYIRISRLKVLKTELNTLADNSWKPLYKSLYKVGVIGDSYSSIRLYGANGGFDSPFYSWVGFLKRETGMEYKNFSGSGYECVDWIDGTSTRPEKFTEATQEGNLCQVYLVCMGINDAARHNTDYVGTTADINTSNPNNNAQSFIGYYAKIIQKIKAVQPYARFIVYTMPTWSVDGNRTKYEAFNAGIMAIADYFDYVYLADLFTDYYDMYHTEGSPLQNPNGAFVNNGHYTAQAEPMIAEIMSEEMSKIINSNQSDFSKIETIGNIWEPINLLG